MAGPAGKRELGLRDLTFFALSCVVSARWIPLAARAGPGAVTLWILAAIFFVVPLTDAVAALVAREPEAGGLYLWTRRDFGRWHAWLCSWTYWVGIAVLFPTAAMVYAQVGVSLVDPGGTAVVSRVALLAVAGGLIWIALGANLIGLKVGKWAENIGALATLAIGLVLVAVAGRVFARRGTATPMHFIPVWNWGTVSFWAGIAYATSGMEGPGAMAAEIRDPGRTMRRAGWIASALATTLYVSATIAFLVVLPPGQISELNGFAELSLAASQVLGTPWLSTLIAVLVLLGAMGFIGGLGTASSQLPLAAAADGLLPAAFAQVHLRWRTPHRSILALGLLATFLLGVYQLGDSARAAFDELVALMVITGFVPYLYLFGSAWKAGRRLSAISGGFVTVLAIVCAIVPPDGITNVWLFEGKLASGTIAVAVAAWLVYRRSAGSRPAR